MAHKAPESSEKINSLIEEGFIDTEQVDQLREGHYWGMPLVLMADESELSVDAGETLIMTVLPQKRFPIPAEGDMEFEVRTDSENEDKKIFAAIDESIGDVVEFEKIKGEQKLDVNYDEKNTEIVSLYKKSLPHKGIWNRVEEGNKAQIKKSEQYNKIDTIAGKFELHLDQHKDFLAQFYSTFFGLIEIVSQNTGAAIFGEKEMAGMFQKITFSPLANENDIDFDEVLDVEFEIMPVKGSREREWKIIAVVNNKEEENIFSLEAECRITSKRMLERFAQQPKKVVEETKEQVDAIVERDV